MAKPCHVQLSGDGHQGEGEKKRKKKKIIYVNDHGEMSTKTHWHIGVLVKPSHTSTKFPKPSLTRQLLMSNRYASSLLISGSIVFDIDRYR